MNLVGTSIESNGQDGKFFGRVEFDQFTINKCNIRGLAFTSEVLNLHDKISPLKVPVNSENEFSIVFNIDDTCVTNPNSIGALSELMTWYHAVRESNVLLHKGKVSVKCNSFRIIFLQGLSELFSISIEGVFPKGFLLSGLSAPGETKIEFFICFDRFLNVSPPSRIDPSGTTSYFSTVGKLA